MDAGNRDLLGEILSRNRLLAMLRVLLRAPAYRMNSEVLCIWLDELALSAGEAVCEADLRRLEELGLSDLEKKGDLICATLTQQGADVAKGLVQVEGVARPSPGCPY